MRKLKLIGYSYLVISNLIASIFIYRFTNRIQDIVVNIIIGCLGIYIINDFFKKKHKLSEMIFILSIYNLFISGGMFLSDHFTRNSKIVDSAISIFISSCIIMIVSKILMDKNKSYNINQFNRWSIVGIISGVASILFIAITVKISNEILKILLLFMICISFIFMILSLYKIVYYRNKM